MIQITEKSTTFARYSRRETLRGPMRTVVQAERNAELIRALLRRRPMKPKAITRIFQILPKSIIREIQLFRKIRISLAEITGSRRAAHAYT